MKSTAVTKLQTDNPAWKRKYIGKVVLLMMANLDILEDYLKTRDAEMCKFEMDLIKNMKEQTINYSVSLACNLTSFQNLKNLLYTKINELCDHVHKNLNLIKLKINTSANYQSGENTPSVVNLINLSEMARVSIQLKLSNYCCVLDNLCEQDAIGNSLQKHSSRKMKNQSATVNLSPSNQQSDMSD